MTAVVAVVLAALSTTPAGLDAAQAAFASGDFALAESLARAAARPPQQGAALNLIGLSRFRAGHPSEALEAFEQAVRTADPPPAAVWRYNKASCLYDLGRFAEAEADYVEATRLDPSLAAVALANAGFAALDGGAADRAKDLADRARALATGAATGLVADLDAHVAASGGDRAADEYREGITAFDAGRFAEAKSRFQRAADLEPDDGKSRIMAGASALRLGERQEARRKLQSALSLPLGDTDAEAARDYLDTLSYGLPARGRGWEGVARVGAGFDSDALQTGFTEPNEFPGTGDGATPSALTTADLVVAYRSRPAETVFTELSYAFDQLAYLAPAASDRSLQQHTLAFVAEHSLRDDFRVGGSATGQLAFTGLSDFRGLQASLGVGAFAAIDEGEPYTSRFDLEYTRKQGLSEFGYLTGDRVDATLMQELRLPAATLAIGYRFRAELIGTSYTNAFVDPFGYYGNTFWAAVRGRAFSVLTYEISSGVEWRGYLDDNYRIMPQMNGTFADIDRIRREDFRFFVGASASVALSRTFSLWLRYDLVMNASNVGSDAMDGPGGHCAPGDQCQRYAADDRSYDKHAVSLGTAVSW